LRVSRIATVVLGLVAIVLGIIFEKQNVAFMVGLAFAVAASANFPVLILSMFWRGLTTRGATIGGFLGLIVAVILTLLGPAVWVKTFGHAQPIFPYDTPAIFSMPLAFLTCWLFSVMDKSAAAEREGALFLGQFVRSQTGIGASGGNSH
jgi:cation/acetate symporter